MLKLKDCSLIPIDQFAKHKQFGTSSNKAKEQALSWLVKLSKKTINDGELFKLSDSQTENEPIVYTDMYGQWWTGRYIGSLHFEGITIEIEPRFGMTFVANNIPLNNFLPVEINDSFTFGDKFIHLLQAMLWINLLVKATRHTLPMVKCKKHHTSAIAKGRIDVRATIKTQTKDKSKITSINSHKNINNPITTLVVLAFIEINSWFKNHDLRHWLPKASALKLQQMINATHRHASIPKMKEIQSVRLGSMAKAYQPLAKLSLDILKNKGLSERHSETKNSTFLLDVAELWEIYLFNVLREALPAQFEVQHGTHSENDTYLLTNQDGSQKLGKLIPDYLFLQNGKCYSLGDAKYKRLGHQPWMSPKRDDIYQITAYLSRYSECSHANVYYPDWQESDKSNKIEDNNPWRLQSDQQINFISVPTDKSKAISLLSKKLL